MSVEQIVATLAVGMIALACTIPALIALRGAIKYSDDEGYMIALSFGLPAIIFWVITYGMLTS